MEQLASEAGIARATLHRARKLAGIVVEQDKTARGRGRHSAWRLPNSSQSLTATGETNSEPALTSENASPEANSSHVSVLETKETKAPEASPREMKIALYKKAIEDRDPAFARAADCFLPENDDQPAPEGSFGPFATCSTEGCNRSTYYYTEAGDPLCATCKKVAS